MKRILYVLCLILLSSCFKAYKGKIKIDGSSTVYPLTEAVAEEFRNIEPDIRITVGVSGTGGGFKKFIRRETDISNASRAISKKEADQCKELGIEFIELPVSYDGLAVVVNPANAFVDYLTVDELKTLWSPASQGKIMRWSQVRKGWPDQPVHLYGAGTSSGTYDYFTEAINGKAKASRGDYTASEDDNVLVQGVASDLNGLAYFGLAYYLENKAKLKLVPIKYDAHSKAVLPSEATVQSGEYKPLARPEFIYVNKKSASDPHVHKFINFYMENAAALAREIGSVPLPADVYKLSFKRFVQGKTGSLFQDRSVVGANLRELFMEENK